MNAKYMWMLMVLLFSGLAARAQLQIKIDETKRVGDKTLVRLLMKNGFDEKIESARAQVLLLNEKGKVVSQAVQWVIGGSKAKEPLGQGASRNFHFVVSGKEPFTKIKVTFTRIILEGGRSMDPKGHFQVEGGESS